MSFPGARDPGQVVLLGLGERGLDLVAEPAVGQAQERGVQGQVGAPARRGVQGLEVQHRELAEELEDQGAGATAGSASRSSSPAMMRRIRSISSATIPGTGFLASSRTRSLKNRSLCGQRR